MNPLKRSLTAPAPAAAADLFARLQRHPDLYAQVAALLDEVENRAGVLNTGDEAEDAIVERMRQFGQQALSGWAERRHAEVQPARTPGLRPVDPAVYEATRAVQPARTPGLRQVGKKNSGG